MQRIVLSLALLSVLGRPLAAADSAVTPVADPSAGNGAPAPAADLTWDWLPTIAYEGDVLEFAVRPLTGPAATPAEGRPSPLSAWGIPGDGSAPRALAGINEADGVLRLRCPAGDLAGVAFVRGDAAPRAAAAGALRATFVRPGDGTALAIDGPRLATDAGPAVLVLPQVEVSEDRRFALLRPADQGLTPRPVCLRLAAPGAGPVAWGTSPLLHQLVILRQHLRAAGKPGGVLIELSPLERHVAWKHREFRQTLAFAVADLQARGVATVVIALAPTPPGEPDALAALNTQARDVAAAYHLPVIDAPPTDPSHWALPSGATGEDLNPAGRAARDATMRPWLMPGAADLTATPTPASTGH